MIKNIMDKVAPKKEKEVKDPEILELRKKFQEIKQSSPAVPGASSAASQQGDESLKQGAAESRTQPSQAPGESAENNAAAPAASPPEPEKPDLKQVKVKLIDAEQAEKDERMTNMIMEQIKELIEIDNNLNNKIRDLDGKLESTNNEIEKVKRENEDIRKKMDILEKSLEKFMALYEVVTNQYNPFVADSGNNTTMPEQGGSIPQPKEDNEEASVKEDKTTSSDEKPQTEEETNVQPDNAASNSMPEKTEEAKGEARIIERYSVGSRPTAPDSGMLDYNEIDSRISKALSDFRNEYDLKISKEINDRISETLMRIEKTINDQLQNSIKGIIETAIDERMGNAQNTPAAPEGQKDSEHYQKQQANEGTYEKEQQPFTDDNVTTNAEPAAFPEETSSDEAPLPESQTETEEEQNQENNEESPLHHEQEVHPDDYFYLPNGKPVKTLSELVEEINMMSDADFAMHVNDEKNDFAEWIEHVINNRTLADRIRELKTKHDILGELIRYIGS